MASLARMSVVVVVINQKIKHWIGRFFFGRKVGTKASRSKNQHAHAGLRGLRWGGDKARLRDGSRMVWESWKVERGG